MEHRRISYPVCLGRPQSYLVLLVAVIVAGVVPCIGVRDDERVARPVIAVHMKSRPPKCETVLDVQLWRQGKFTSVGSDFTLSEESLHQEYVVSIVTNSSVLREGLLFAATVPSLAKCGEQHFSQPRLTCSNNSITREISANSRTAHLDLPSNRGFGVEFEFLAQALPAASRVLLTEDDIDDIKSMSHGDYAEAVNNIVKDSFGGPPVNTTVKALKKDLRFVPGILDMMQIPSLRKCFNLMGEAFPQTLDKWRWDADHTVSHELGGQAVNGIGLEVTSPILSKNLRPVSSMLQGLAKLGVAAPKSAGLHVHINVGSQKGPGGPLTFRGIAQVWVAWVQYQLVIDEMLSPGRQGNEHAQQLFISTREACKNWCPLFASLFENMFLDSSLESAKDIDVDGSAAQKRGLQLFSRADIRRRLKYLQLNLESLFTYGTLEFRAHSATYDESRVLNWIHFLMRFVEHFGSPGSPTARFFSESPTKLEAGRKFEELVIAQRAASITKLFDDIGLPGDMKTFYLTRKWEAGSSQCGVDQDTQARDAIEVQGLLSQAQTDACK